MTEFVMVFRHLHGSTGGKTKNKKKILFWISSVRVEIQRRDILVRKGPYIVDRNIKLQSWFYLRKFCPGLRCAKYE